MTMMPIGTLAPVDISAVIMGGGMAFPANTTPVEDFTGTNDLSGLIVTFDLSPMGMPIMLR